MRLSTAVVIAFAITVILGWLYFNVVSRRSTTR
jgi:uncharacterized membrane protein YciS (DUF1049 family)